MDDLVNTSGRVLGGLLSANEIYHGGLMRYLTNRQALLQDPSLRGSLGPFGAGLLQVGGSQVKQSAPGEPEMAGFSPEQAAQMGVQVVGPSPTFGGAVDPTGSRFVPNLPPLSPEAQVQQQLARSTLGLLREPGMSQQAARHQLGIRPSPLEGMEGIIKALGGSTEGLALKQIGPAGPVFVPAGQTDLQQTNVPGLLRAGSRFVRDPRVPSARAPAAGGVSPNAPALPGYVRDPASGKLVRDLSPEAAAQHAAAVAGSKPPTVQVEQELSQISTLDGLIDDAEKLLATPEVQQKVGFVAGRVGFGLYKTGALADPLPIEFNTIRELVKILSIGRLARAAGSRSYQVWRELDIHPPQAGDNIIELQTKLKSLRHVLRRSAAATANVAQTPRSRLGTIVPPAEPLGAGAGTNPMQTTPGGNSYRVLGE